MIKKLFNHIKKIRKETSNLNIYNATHMVEEIYEENNEKRVVIRVIGKALIFKMLPNEILADDDLTMTFSPLDVRTLTGLGYHNITDPKIKILSEKTDKNGEKLYMVSEKGKEQIKAMKHVEMMSEGIRKNLSNVDSFKLGSETSIQESIKLNKTLECSKKIIKK